MSHIMITNYVYVISLERTASSKPSFVRWRSRVAAKLNRANSESLAKVSTAIEKSHHDGKNTKTPS